MIYRHRWSYDGSRAIKVTIEYKSETHEIVDLSPNTTVSKLKSVLYKIFAVPRNQQCVIFQDNPLHDDNPHLLISTCGVIDDSKLALRKNKLDDKLLHVLIFHRIFSCVLYDILNDNEYDIDLLSEMTEEDISEFCVEFNLSEKHQEQFKRLIRIVKEYDALQYEQEQIQLKEADYKVDLLIIGDIGVGKTSLMNRFLYDTFDEKYSDLPSIAVESKRKKIEVGNHKIVEIEVIDTAGQEMHDSIPRMYYRKGDCVMICYDISDPQSFRNVLRWREMIHNYGEDDAVVMLIGNKSDLSNENRIQYETKALEIINRREWKNHCTFYAECSAKNGDNVRNIFNVAAEMGLERISGKGKARKIKVSLEGDHTADQKCCNNTIK